MTGRTENSRPWGAIARIVTIGLLAIACATPLMRAQTDLYQGRYDAAARGFTDVLARQPERIDAVVGLGVARYKGGDLEGAAFMLDRALTLAPKDLEARLYLALTHLRQSRDAQAEAQLAGLAAMPGVHPRLRAHVQRTRDLVAADGVIADDVRTFVAAGLEDALEWDEDLVAARRLASLAVPAPHGWDHSDPYRWMR
jgi:tetratricopeptide (TPR) repeat protein